MKQISFFKKGSTQHGGVLSLNKRKRARPLAKNKAIHLVLKSRTTILFKNKCWILKLLRQQASSKGVRIYSVSVQKDHIHIVLRIYSRHLYSGFIRAVTGVIAKRLGKGLWKFIPFTRFISWGRDFKAAKAYVFQNEMEVLGIWGYQPRRRRAPQ